MAKKQNNLFLIAGLGFVAYLLFKNKAATQIPVDTAPPPVLPQTGDLTISDQREALKNYAVSVGKDWSSALQKMNEYEIVTVFNFIYNCRLVQAQGGKCIPKPSDLQRMQTIGVKFGIVI